MDKNVLQAIEGVAIYPLISFGIFFAFFLGLLAYVLLVKPDLMREMKNLPFGADEAEPGLLPLDAKGGAPC